MQLKIELVHLMLFQVPDKSAMLEVIFNERSKELYNETGDRFLIPGTQKA